MHQRSSSRLPGSLWRTCALPAFILAANAGILVPVQAGSEVYPPHETTKTVVKPEHVHRPKVSKLPYLVLVEPEPLKIQRAVNPHFRNPPLLPTPKPAPVVSKAPATPSPDDANANKPVDTGVLPSESSPILLPKDKQPAMPAPADHGKQDPVLTPAPSPEQELKDAVIYFDTPVGPHGTRAIVPVPIPGLTPGATQPVVPDSHTTYREVEK